MPCKDDRTRQDAVVEETGNRERSKHKPRESVDRDAGGCWEVQRASRTEGGGLRLLLAVLEEQREDTHFFFSRKLPQTLPSFRVSFLGGGPKFLTFSNERKPFVCLYIPRISPLGRRPVHNGGSNFTAPFPWISDGHLRFTIDVGGQNEIHVPRIHSLQFDSNTNSQCSRSPPSLLPAPAQPSSQ